MQQRKLDPDYLLEKEAPVAMTESEKKYRLLIAGLKRQDYKKDRKVLKYELEQLQIKNTTSPLVRKGNSVLDKLRCDVPEDIYQKLSHNEQNLQMSMLNDYLNGYTEKLARATTTDPSSIKIDQLHFNKIVKSVNASTFNPYREFGVIKDEIK